METKGSATIDIAASPEDVYNLLIDLGRIGEISPECQSAEWLDGATAPHAGARFVGRNATGGFEWQTECRVLRAMPGEEWAFKSNIAGDNPTTWRYKLRRTDGGSQVTVTFDAPSLSDPGLQKAMPGRYEKLCENIATSLDNLKRLAEG
jgi:hypothetical protein